MNMYRQGDVLLVRVDAMPNGAIEQEAKGDTILAYGEVTGHAHRIEAKARARIWSAGAERFLRVIETTALTHEEHAPVRLEPGVYRLPQQTEYTPAELRRVED